MKFDYSTLLKTIAVLLLASVISFAGVTAIIYWLATPLSITNVLLFLVGYFVILKPCVKYWSNLLVFLAEYRTIKAQMQQRQELMENFKRDMQVLQSGNESDRERITNEYKAKLESVFKNLKEEQNNEQ